MKIKYLYFFMFVLFFAGNSFSQPVVVNELMPSNTVTVTDEDGDYSDWFELFNTQDSPLNLSGFGISDDPLTPFKWVLPELTIPAKDHLLIFASDKNRTEWVRHWETVIDWGDVWKYRLGISEPPAAWKDLSYNDQSWSSGPSGFGYGDDDDSTVISQVNSLYIRKVFNVENISSVIQAVLHVDYDDAFVAYLNGVEIARANIGTLNIPPAYNQSADEAIEALIYQGERPSVFVVENIQSLLQQGNNILAIQVHNYGTNSSDMTCIPFFTLGMNEVPVNPHGTHPLLILPNSYLHTNFKLSGAGENLVVTNPDGVTIDNIQFGDLSADISFGRKPDGSNNWVLFYEATPGDSNVTTGYTGISSEPLFSTGAGFYQSAVNVILTPGSAGETIRYTLDGSDPDESSSIYTSPIQVTSTKVLRAREFGTGLIPGKIITNTYFINVSSDLTVVSLSTAPSNFFDEEFGIYTTGDSAETDFPFFGANFWKDWERPVHVELFETDGTQAFSIDAGVQIFGGWSRGHPQKSLAIFARSQYGPGSINYKFFPELPITEFESFVLRNSGNDWTSTMFRDGLITGLVDNIDIDKQAFRPAIVFINGEYWGIHNIREKVNEHFLASHHDVDPDNVDILEGYAEVVEGSDEHYLSMLDFIENNSLAVAQNYEYIKTQMDVDNFIKYMLTEIYAANTDWPGGNIKYWRPRTANGKWRWILFDTDFGFDLYGDNTFSHNTLTFATETNGPEWPNPPWSTFLLRKLLVNQSFKNEFINYFCDLTNTVFKPSVVVAKINSMKSAIESEIPRHHSRWNQMDDWSNEIQRMIQFANNRVTYMRLHFTQFFNPGTITLISLTNIDTLMGSVKVNSVHVNQPSWSGNYFATIPIVIIAQPKAGYRFVRWEGSISSTNDTLSFQPTSSVTLTPVFEVSTATPPAVVINEINYNSTVTFNTEDWLELFNNTDSTVDLSNWVFKDEEEIHSFVLPAGTILNPGGFIVLVYDTALFKPLFPNVSNYIGNFGFGLSGGGEKLRLYDNIMNLIDSLTYDDQNPWPEEADGNGPTLSLKNPDLDNSLPGSWGTSLNHGTPGTVNDNLTDVDNNDKELPVSFSLEQNYPNPFNPLTRIRFSIPLADANNSSTVRVIIKVFDILGREITTLVDEDKQAGIYEISFDTQEYSLSSGIYFYRMNSGKFSVTKKFVVLK